MNKGSFKALVYREFCIVKPAIPPILICILTMSLFPILIVLSFRFGNLALIQEIKLEDLVDGLITMPVLCAAMFSLTAADALSHDISPAWEHFRKSTPVSPMKLALAKYTVISIQAAVSFVMSFSVLLLMCAVVGTPVTAPDLAIALAINTICILYAVTAQLMITYFRNRDKAMFATMLILMGILFSLFLLTDNIKPEGRSMEEQKMFLTEIKNGCLEYAPVMIMLIIVLICGGCFATSLLYKRREK